MQLPERVIVQLAKLLYVDPNVRSRGLFLSGRRLQHNPLTRKEPQFLQALAEPDGSLAFLVVPGAELDPGVDPVRHPGTVEERLFRPP